MNKPFLLKCSCGWKEQSTGLSNDLSKFTEIKQCENCGKKRKFICPKCKAVAIMYRVKGNV